jgi:hypothetical protein
MWVLTEEDNAAAMALYGATGGQRAGDSSMMFEYDLGLDRREGPSDLPGLQTFGAVSSQHRRVKRRLDSLPPKAR